MDEKEARLRELLKEVGKIVVPYSGGIDSSYLSKESSANSKAASNSLWHSIGSIVRGNALSLKMAAERRRPQNLS